MRFETWPGQGPRTVEVCTVSEEDPSLIPRDQKGALLEAGTPGNQWAVAQIKRASDGWNRSEAQPPKVKCECQKVESQRGLPRWSETELESVWLQLVAFGLPTGQVRESG